MRWSQTLIPTLRQVPAEAEVPSHKLMLRAGLIQKLSSGAYSYLPLGLRVLQKAKQIVREEMNRAGAVELLMPALQPIELWEKTGRRWDYGDNLFVVKDRHGRENALGPTHEEVVTHLASQYVSSYRQLPLTLYQIQTKFRDEFRPRFGVLRSREFIMKDAYSFHTDIASLDETYDALYNAYCRIFERCGVPYVIVEAESGPIGGSASHEFMVPSPTGEDLIVSSNNGNYAANVEKAEIGERSHSLAGDPTGELDKVHTPDQKSIDDVCKFMKVKPKNMIKTLVCRSGDKWVIAVVRGDHELNEAKLREVIGGESVEMADDTEARDAGFAIGFVGPHAVAGRDDVLLIIDPDAAQEQFWASGANEADHHVKHFNWKRDVLDHVDESVVKVADIRNALAGDPSPKNDGGELTVTQGIEIGHVFKLGAKYSKSLGFTVLNDQQEECDVIMGCYGIGVNRILASAVEADGGNDDAGIIWPKSLAPFDVVITPIRYEGQMQEVADDLAGQLEAKGVEVLLDDRDERPGVKFKDADLIGIPLRITVGDKGLANGEVEYKLRSADKAQMVKLEDLVARVEAYLVE